MSCKYCVVQKFIVWIIVRGYVPCQATAGLPRAWPVRIRRGGGCRHRLINWHRSSMRRLIGRRAETILDSIRLPPRWPLFVREPPSLRRRPGCDSGEAGRTRWSPAVAPAARAFCRRFAVSHRPRPLPQRGRRGT